MHSSSLPVTHTTSPTSSFTTTSSRAISSPTSQLTYPLFASPSTHNMRTQRSSLSLVSLRTTPIRSKKKLKSPFTIPSKKNSDLRVRRNSEQSFRKTWIRRSKTRSPNLVFFCPVCLSYKLATERLDIQPCGHRLCFICAHSYITRKLSERQIPVCCLCLAASYSSPRSPRKSLCPLSDVQCRKVLNAKEMKCYEAVSFGAILQPCFGVDCKGFLPEEKGRTQCTVCQKEWCVTCKVEWHRGLRCTEYQKTKRKKLVLDRVRIKEAIKKFGFKNCPKCNNLIEKISGCNHMTCYPPCKTHFCWRCLATLDPNNLEDHYGKPSTPCYRKMMTY